MTEEFLLVFGLTDSLNGEIDAFRDGRDDKDNSFYNRLKRPKSATTCPNRRTTSAACMLVAAETIRN